MQVSDMMI